MIERNFKEVGIKDVVRLLRIPGNSVYALMEVTENTSVNSLYHANGFVTTNDLLKEIIPTKEDIEHKEKELAEIKAKRDEMISRMANSLEKIADKLDRKESEESKETDTEKVLEKVRKDFEEVITESNEQRRKWSTVNEEEFQEILGEFEQGMSLREIGEKHNLNRNTISDKIKAYKKQ